MEEPSVDKGATSEESAATGRLRTPHCVRCRNHNTKVPLLGHKRYCEYRYCVCSKCTSTKQRQKAMANQIAGRRKKAQDEDRLKKGLPVPPPTPPLDSDNPDTPSSSCSVFNGNSNSNSTNYPKSSSTSGVCSNSNQSAVSSTTNTNNQNMTTINLSTNSNSKNSNDSTLSTSNNENTTTQEESARTTEPVRIESIITLLNMLQYYQVDIHSLLYVILKQVNSDVEAAHRIIVYAQEKLRRLKTLVSPECSPQLPCKPYPLPLSILSPFHQYSSFTPYLKTASTIPPYACQGYSINSSHGVINDCSTTGPLRPILIDDSRTPLEKDLEWKKATSAKRVRAPDFDLPPTKIPRPEMFMYEYIPKAEYKSDVPINLHYDKSYSSSLEV